MILIAIAKTYARGAHSFMCVLCSPFLYTVKLICFVVHIETINSVYIPTTISNGMAVSLEYIHNQAILLVGSTSI